MLETDSSLEMSERIELLLSSVFSWEDKDDPVYAESYGDEEDVELALLTVNVCWDASFLSMVGGVTGWAELSDMMKAYWVYKVTRQFLTRLNNQGL